MKSLQFNLAPHLCSQSRLLSVCSARPDPGNYSAVSGISHIFKKGGKETSHVLMHSLQPRNYLCLRLHKVSKILLFLKHRAFWCVFTNRLFSLGFFFLIQKHLPQKKLQKHSSGRFRGEALRQCQLQCSGPSEFTQVQAKIGWKNYKFAHRMPVSSHHIQG